MDARRPVQPRLPSPTTFELEAMSVNVPNTPPSFYRFKPRDQALVPVSELGDPWLQATFGPLRFMLDSKPMDYTVGRTDDNDFPLKGRFSHLASESLRLEHLICYLTHTM